MVKLLLSHGADFMAEIGEKTPMEFALSNKQFEIHAYLECKLAALVCMYVCEYDSCD